MRKLVVNVGFISLPKQDNNIRQRMSMPSFEGLFPFDAFAGNGYNHASRGVGLGRGGANLPRDWVMLLLK